MWNLPCLMPSPSFMVVWQDQQMVCRDNIRSFRWMFQMLLTSLGGETGALVGSGGHSGCLEVGWFGMEMERLRMAE